MTQTGFRPLYMQVREVLVSRMADGIWKAGQALPSEFALADELGVSQGTVRKALNAMAAENLVERHQGRGTYVPEHTQERALFQFFRITTPDGTRIIPELVSHRITLIRPPTEVTRLFRLDTPEKLWRVERSRKMVRDGDLYEEIYLRPDLMPGINETSDLPNALYSYYQQVDGISVARAEDFLRARLCDKRITQKLNLPEGSAILEATRTAYDLRDRIVEVRKSCFDTGKIGYSVSLF